MATEWHGGCGCGDRDCPSGGNTALRCDSCGSLIPAGNPHAAKLILVPGDQGNVSSFDLCEVCRLSPIVISDIGREKPFFQQHYELLKEFLIFGLPSHPPLIAAQNPED